MSTLPRRLVSVPVVFLSAGALIGGLPLMVPLLALGDAARRGPGGLLRGYLFLTLFAWAEVVGVVVAAFIGADPARNYALQRQWAGVLWTGARRIYGLTLRVEADPGMDRGPPPPRCAPSPPRSVRGTSSRSTPRAPGSPPRAGSGRWRSCRRRGGRWRRAGRTCSRRARAGC